MKSKIEVVGKPREKGDGKLLVTLQRSLSEEGITWKPVETRYVLLKTSDLDTQEKVDAFIAEQGGKAVEQATAPKGDEVDAPLLEGKAVQADTTEALPIVEIHPAGPPNEDIPVEEVPAEEPPVKEPPDEGALS